VTGETVVAEGDEIDAEENMWILSDLDNSKVDHEFIGMIMDTLEAYQFYQMTMMLSNRYKMTGRQSNYLVLMCTKYSNMAEFRLQLPIQKGVNTVNNEVDQALALLMH
jgi:hypothetical protein